LEVAALWVMLHLFTTFMEKIIKGQDRDNKLGKNWLLTKGVLVEILFGCNYLSFNQI
jgi:hypothetical protein